MKYELNPNRTQWLIVLVGLATNIAICYVLVRVFKDTYDWSDIMWVFLAMIAIDLAFWIRNTLAGSLAFRLIGKDFVRRNTVNILSTNEMPNPEEFFDDPEFYFSEILEDDNSTRGQTIVAANNLGQLQMPYQSGRLVEAMRIASAFKSALEEYRTLVPQSHE